MARLARCEVLDPDEINIVHAINRTVRRCFLMGDDPISGKNFDHRKAWIEKLLRHFAAYFGIDLLCYSILSNHSHLILRTRPDVVATWSDTEVARRWLMICPLQKINGEPAEPTEAELNSIRNCPIKLAEIRKRHSSVSWWIRLLNQRVAQRANRADEAQGRFWQDRYRAIRIDDEESLLACAAYVELNPIRAAIAETLEQSEFTSIKQRIDAEQESRSTELPAGERRDAFLAQLTLDEQHGPLGSCPSEAGNRCVTVHQNRCRRGVYRGGFCFVSTNGENPCPKPRTPKSGPSVCGASNWLTPPSLRSVPPKAFPSRPTTTGDANFGGR